MREIVDEQVAREFLDGEDVDEEGVAFESLEREGEEDLLGGENGGGEEDYIWVLLEEVVGVGIEADAEGGGEGGVVGAGVGEEGVMVSEECFGEELTEVAEAN
ncbi:hypothetical protein CFOL_v3_29232 [Cephalotus follicularis]|uniref:Uncharacterized protein n=1 Tax=Cephalotus follicularis TaxID=3775 RepID=A0A1Q3D0F5_CEPFO|nr:hypothetical protein CFOL_v3_29232 [Cephalotus follicularis]